MPKSDHHILNEAIKACTLCQAHLPFGARPIVQFSPFSKILIIGQAPGPAVHESGIPWDDASGDRMREWLGVDKAVFYTPDHFALVPMGFCYPGRQDKGGDSPPRPECAPTWHHQIWAAMTHVKLTILTGHYAQRAYMKTNASATMTARVKAWKNQDPAIMPLPHPSWRVVGWMKKNPWFEKDLLPTLQSRVQTALA